MERRINITTKHMIEDLEPILFEGRNHSIFRTIDGCTPVEAERQYLIRIMTDAYKAGLYRAVDEMNKEAEREVSRAQTKATRKLMKMNL
jgi:hypothetical protein